MDVSLSPTTLVSCRCALRAHIKDLHNSALAASTVEFRTLCEDEIKVYLSALADLNKYFKTYHYD